MRCTEPMDNQKRLVVATSNTGKLQEIQNFFPNYTVISAKYLYPDIAEAIEDGASFSENAMKKLAVYPETMDIWIADDSGLEVRALNGEPGVYSARYAGEDANSLKNCQKLLMALTGIQDRSAKFTTVLAIRYPERQPFTCEGSVSGVIAHDMQGAKGFGYDPLFIPDGYTVSFANLDTEIKNKISHRGRALSQLHQYLDQ